MSIQKRLSAGFLPVRSRARLDNKRFITRLKRISLFLIINIAFRQKKKKRTNNGRGPTNKCFHVTEKDFSTKS